MQVIGAGAPLGRPFYPKTQMRQVAPGFQRKRSGKPQLAAFAAGAVAGSAFGAAFSGFSALASNP